MARQAFRGDSETCRKKQYRRDAARPLRLSGGESISDDLDAINRVPEFCDPDSCIAISGSGCRPAWIRKSNDAAHHKENAGMLIPVVQRSLVR